MNVFLVGVGCVGKTAIGACLAQRLGRPFYDLNLAIEKHFGKPIEPLRAEALTPHSFRKRFASVVLEEFVQAGPRSGFVMALMPSGLMDSMWAVLKKADGVVVVLLDSPENILARITFYDADSRPVAKVLTHKERLHYLSEIRKDIAYFGRSFHRADLTVDIDGLDIERSAIKMEELLRQRRHVQEGGLATMHLFEAIDAIREKGGPATSHRWRVLKGKMRIDKPSIALEREPAFALELPGQH